MYKYALFVLFLIFHFAAMLMAQTDQEQLAKQFMENQEYDKAAEIYEKLYEQNPTNTFYYRELLNAWINIQKWDEIEKLLKKLIRKNPQSPEYRVDLGYVYGLQGDDKKAIQQYEEILKTLPPDDRLIRATASAFYRIKNYDYVIKTYQLGRKLLDNPFLYALELANAYDLQGDIQNAINHYLDYLSYQPGQVQFVKNIFQRKLEDNAYSQKFQMALMERIQKNPQQTLYAELLIWFYIQRKQFDAAFIQAKALDKRLQENGFRIYDLGKAALQAKDYDAAVQCFQYLIDKGQMGAYYLAARQELLKTLKEKITSRYDYSPEDLQKLDEEYTAFIQEFGINQETLQTIRDHALLKAFYLHRMDEAIAMLEKLINLNNTNPVFQASCKLDLGDLYLLKGDIWEASLLYGQVSKAMRDEPLGELARFKNAKISYYTGDFEWAQTQLDVLKGATSELISNDAIELSVFITDNLGLDSTSIPMQKFAKAELLIYQNKFDDALAVLDSIKNTFPGHPLEDDILYTEARIDIQRKNYASAMEKLQTIVDKYPDEILADNAIIQLAGLYADVFKDKEKAMEYYQKILIDYKDSIFVNEAREKYRMLRGDFF